MEDPSNFKFQVYKKADEVNRLYDGGQIDYFFLGFLGSF